MPLARCVRARVILLNFMLLLFLLHIYYYYYYYCQVAERQVCCLSPWCVRIRNICNAIVNVFGGFHVHTVAVSRQWTPELIWISVEQLQRH